MNDSANTLTVNYSKSADLKAAMGNKDPGEECEVTLKLISMESNEDEAKFSIKKVTYVMDGEDKETEPDAKEPAMIEMKIGDEKMPVESAAY